VSFTIEAGADRAIGIEIEIEIGAETAVAAAGDSE
jgi:hypothetical protein